MQVWGDAPRNKGHKAKDIPDGIPELPSHLTSISLFLGGTQWGMCELLYIEPNSKNQTRSLRVWGRNPARWASAPASVVNMINY